MWKLVTSITALFALSACDGRPLTFDATPLAVKRFYANTWQDKAFDEGVVTVLQADHGDLRSFTLTPCRSGTHICGSQAGHLALTPDYAVVTGAYSGRTFYLSPGGDGYVKRHGQLHPIAWDE